MALLREMIGSFCLDPDPDEVEARSLLAFCVAIGHHSLAAGHEGRTATGGPRPGGRRGRAVHLTDVSVQISWQVASVLAAAPGSGPA